MQKSVKMLLFAVVFLRCGFLDIHPSIDDNVHSVAAAIRANRRMRGKCSLTYLCTFCMSIHHRVQKMRRIYWQSDDVIFETG